MAWTYSGSPSSSAKDEVRFLVGDTDVALPLVQDEEVQYALDNYADSGLAKVNYAAASLVAEGIAAKFARKMDRSIGPLSVSAKQQRDHYVELADSLRAKAGLPADDVSRLLTRMGSPVLSGGGPTYLGGDW